MHKSPVKFRFVWLPAARITGFFCLVALLLVPVSMQASLTQATVNREGQTHRLHSSAHRVHRQRRFASRRARNRTIHVSHSVRHSRQRRQLARVHRVTRHRRALEARSRAQRYELEATLHKVHTHTAPPANGERAALADNQVEAPHEPVLMEAKAQSTTSNAVDTNETAFQGNVARRDLPFFNEAIPSYMPAALRGSHEVLVHQNIIADVEGLSRIQNDTQLSAMVHSGELVALPASSGLVIDPRLPFNRRYCRPWVAKFLSDLSRAHERTFGDPLQLTSAVRTVNFQRHLARYNGNAAPTSGDTASPHLTGEAIDLGKKGMSRHEIAWMRAVLGQLQESGRLDVEEEFEQACFHISVYKTYVHHNTLPASLIASDGASPTDEVRTQDAAATEAIGGLVQPVNEPVGRRAEVHHARSYRVHGVRRAAVHHRRRRHRATMSLLAARMR